MSRPGSCRPTGLTITAYILRQTAAPFFATTVLMVLILFVLNLLQMGELVFGGGFSALLVLKMFVFMLPKYLPVIIPFALIVSAIVVFGRMADDCELIALEAAGVSRGMLYLAPAIIGAAASVLTLFLQLYGETWGFRSMYPLVIGAMKEKITYNFKEGINDELMYIVTYFGKKGREPRSWETVFIFLMDREWNPTLMSSRTGEIKPLPDTKGIAIEMKNGVLHQPGAGGSEYSVVSFRRNSLEIDLATDLGNRTPIFTQASMMYPEDIEEAIGKAEPGSREKNKLSMSLNGKYSTSLAPFLLMLAVVPLAAVRHRWGRAANFALCSGVLLAYFIVLRMFTVLGEKGVLPCAAAAWIPLIFLSVLVLIAPFARRNAG